MTLGERLDELLKVLPDGWALATVVVTVADPTATDRAALILGPLSPGRSGPSFRLRLSRAGGQAPSVDAVRRALERLEREGVDARLSMPDTAVEVAPPAAPQVTAPPRERARTSLAAAYDEIAARLPKDWSDLHLEVELASSDDVERAALLMAPVNPFLADDARSALRFRVARTYGYGAAPQMGRRVLARLDEDEIRGTLRLLRVHSDVKPAHTQGLVWREAGRAV